MKKLSIVILLALLGGCATSSADHVGDSGQDQQPDLFRSYKGGSR